MRITEFSVRNHQFTVVLFLMLSALGVTAFLNAPRSEDPAFPISTFLIVAVYPGAGPNDLEEMVVDPVEEALKELEDIKRIRADIEDGLAVITVDFREETDAEKKHDEVIRQLNSVRGGLPEGLVSLEVTKFSTTNVNIVQFALVSETAPFRELRAQADHLKARLESVPGLKKVEVWASPGQDVRVSLDLERASQLGIPVNHVIGAIRASNVNIPAGNVEIGARRFNVKTSGRYESLDQIRNTVIASQGGQNVLLGQVADVDMEDEELDHIGRYDGKRAVFVTASQQANENIFAIRKAMDPLIKAFRDRLGTDIRLETGFDQSVNVGKRLDGFTIDFFIAIALVTVTLLPLGIRAALIVMVSIPLSLAIGLFLLYMAGFSVNQLSIVGFVIALGLLVDDSIVVTENITRFLRQGYSRREAAIKGCRQIGVAVLGCTATMIFAFLPLLFLPGGPGRYIRSMPVALVFTVSASLLVSLTIIPFLASVLLNREENKEGNIFLRGLNRVIEGSYRRWLGLALRNPRGTAAAAGALFLASLTLIPLMGFSLFPKAGTPQFLVTIETPEGSSLEETDRAARFVEAALARRPEVESYMASVGRGNPMIYYNVIPGRAKANVAEVFARLREYRGGDSEALLDRLRDDFLEYPAARIEVKEFQNGPVIEAPIAFRVVGGDMDTLRMLAGLLEQAIAETPGAIYVNNPLRQVKTDVKVAVESQRSGMLGVSMEEIDKSIRLGLSGLKVGSYRAKNGKDHDIDLCLRKDSRRTIGDLHRIHVSAYSGAQIPLRQIADIGLHASASTINHFNRERSGTVTADVASDYQTDRVAKHILAKLSSIPFPDGYRYVAAGEIESRQESFGGMGNAIIIAVFGTIAILLLEFKTFKSTLIVASVIPLGVIGGLLALFLSGNSLSFTASVGFIALIGIEVKNSILLVDFTNRLRAEGMELDEAIRKAGEIRFVPILLTTLTALGGLIPIALGNSPLYSPLALVIIGGLISSTFLTRLVTPVMYRLLAPHVEPAA